MLRAAKGQVLTENSSEAIVFGQILLTLESTLPTLSSPLDANRDAERSSLVPATLSLLIPQLYEEVCDTLDKRRAFMALVRGDTSATLSIAPDRVAVLDCRKHEYLGTIIVDVNILPDLGGASSISVGGTSSNGTGTDSDIKSLGGRAAAPFELAERFLERMREWWYGGASLGPARGLLEKVKAATILSRFGQLEAENAYLLEQSALMMARLDEVLYCHRFTPIALGSSWISLG